ncbi:MAG: T9SS type A sorting domain-containing protein [Flavobacteriales bacterium]|jgi:hypothetical protein|nr:T9SS type A sorting domain-containing protein [Flavobacteriales bacterium]
MKNKYFFLVLVLTQFTFNSKAQNDTLFYENFDNWPTREADSIFVNYDEDQVADANGLPGGWFVANFANGGADSLEKVALSSSWLIGAQNGNRNYMMLPSLYISDTNAVLSWRSAPALGHLYMDGYTVGISTDSLFYYYFSFGGQDTLTHFAQNINDNETDFSDGIMHTYFDSAAGVNLVGTIQYPGLLSPWSVDLSDYAGQKVFILFAHNSDDDNYIAIDDIMVTGTKSQTILVGDTNGNGVIDAGEIAGDINGDGVIGTGETAGDVNGSGSIGAGELAGDINGDGVIGAGEILGDANGNGILDGSELNNIGLKDLTSAFDINIYPNPVKDFLKIKSNSEMSSVMIYSATGQLVYENTANNKTIDTSNLSTGMYNVVVRSASGQASKTFLKQ